MKKLFTLILISLFTLGLVSCALIPEKEEGKSYVSLGINPSIELIVDANEEVLEVYATNDDAKVLLYEEVNLVGMDLEEALKVITNLSIEYGFLEEDNKVIDFSISSTLNDTYQADLKATIEATMTEEASSKGLNISLTTEGAFTLLRELEQLKAENPDNSLIQNLTVEKFKLISSAQSSDDSLTLEVAVTLNEEELMNRISLARDEVYNIATAKFDALVVESEIAYEKALNSFNRSIYASYYMKDLTTMMNHPVNYGALYSMYGIAADSLDGILRVIEVVENYKKSLLTDSQIELVVASITPLGVAADVVKEGIKDSDGNVTIESVNAYLDKLIKNIVNEELKDEIASIKDAINQLEATVKTECAKLQEAYRPQIEQMLTVLETTKKTIESTLAMLPETLKETFNVYITEMGTMISTMKEALEGEVTVDTIKGWKDSFRAKEAELLTKINEDLSEEELAEIETLKQKVSTELTNAKQSFETAVNNAITTVKGQLETLKSQREQKAE